MKVQARRSAASRRSRTTAVVGATAAVGTMGLMALAAGTALAEEPGRCNETVNVRAEPDVASPLVGVCPAGTAVQVGEIREGFLYLTDYEGWAAWEYVSLGGEQTADPASPTENGAAVEEPAAGEVTALDGPVNETTGETSYSEGTPSTTPTVPDGS
jgi:hypothetical protein